MTKKKVILVTGVSGDWGGRVAARLVAESGQQFPDLDAEAGADGIHVLGLDIEPPDPEIKGLDFIQADIRNPLLIDLLRSESVHTVVHMAFMESARPIEASFDYNVIGAMKVLGACAEAGVKKVVLKSSTMVYGALPSNPAFLTEQYPLNGSRKNGVINDLVEIEAFCNGFRRQTPQMTLTVLRFPNIIGPTADTPMTRFLSQPWTPVLMGFDPLVQVIHEQDVLEALVFAIHNDASGAFNVAAEGVLPLRKLMSLAGKLGLPIFHLAAYWGRNLAGRAGSDHYLPIELDYMRYPWVADLEQMRHTLGFTPRYTAEEALREYAGQQRLRGYQGEEAALKYDEERLRDTIERRRRLRERAARAAHNGGRDLSQETEGLLKEENDDGRS